MTDQFPITMRGTTAEILLHEPIGEPFLSDEGMTSKRFAEQLKQYPQAKEIHLRLNSPGGSLYHALGMHAALRGHGAKVRATVEGAALSAASLLLMAADDITMSKGSVIMLHEPQMSARGKASDIRRTVEALDRATASAASIYATRSKKSEDEVRAMMTAETWMDANEAVAAGFADKVSGDAAMAFTLDPQMFSRIPTALVGKLKKPATPTPPTSGVDPLPAGSPQASGGGSKRDEFFAIVADKVTAGMKRERAVSMAIKESPRLYQEMLEEVNTNRGAR